MIGTTGSYTTACDATVLPAASQDPPHPRCPATAPLRPGGMRVDVGPRVARRLLRFELERICARAGVTHGEMGARLGVSRASFSQAVAGKNLLSRPALEVLATHLDAEDVTRRQSTLSKSESAELDAIAHYQALFDELRERAHSPDRSRELIAGLRRPGPAQS